MKSLPLTSKIRESFASRIFIVISLFVVMISILFTICFIRHQGEKMREILVKEGELLANMLAFSGRLGVYAENEDLLKDPVEGIMRHNDVKKVSIFNFNGTLLREEWNGADRNVENEAGMAKNYRLQSITKLKALEKPFHFQHDRALEIWVPVYIESLFISKKAPPLAGKPNQSHDQVIGFVNVTLGLDSLEKSLHDLLVKCCIAVFLFLLAALLAAYHASIALSGPLRRLAERVGKITEEGAAEKLPIETNDEIGKLAGSFNNLVESLQKRTVEKELLEEQVRQTQKMEAVGSLAGVAVHDFKNMLTAIIGYGVLLQNSMPKRNALNIYVEKILAAADKAVNLTRRLQAFGRKNEAHLKPVNLNKTVMDLENILSRLFEKNTEVRILPAEDDIIVKADEGQIEQVIIKLATNAREAMPHGGTLTISTTIVEREGKSAFTGVNAQAATCAMLTVADTGIGMDEETKERIFEPFCSTGKTGYCKGFGLSIIHDIIRQHSGHIEVNSTPGKGTRVTVLLPLHASTMESRKLEPLLMPKGKRETVLLAEDDRFVRKLARHILAKYDYHVIEAADGDEAVRIYQENSERIDILLLDVIMPKMNGYQAHEAIARLQPGIKTLHMSAMPSEIAKEEYLIGEGHHFISKPLLPGVLLTKIREVLES